MAIGDIVHGMSDVAAGSALTIQPGAGVEESIHNIYHAAEVELYIVEGANELLFDDASAKGSWSAYFFHLTNTHYIKVKNTNAASKLIGYDGIVSKE
jgi:hypothetical protein